MLISPRETSYVPEPYAVPLSKQFDGNDGDWSTFKISVGTPGQDFRVLASTQSGVTQVIVPEGCLEGEGTDCANSRGIDVFNSAQSPGFQVNISKSWSTIGQYDVDTESRLGLVAPGLFGYDVVALGPAADSTSLSLDHQVVAGMADPIYFTGFLPLGIPDASFSSLSKSIDSFIYQLRNQTKIPSLSFAYTAGAKYRLKSVFASLILGGYDSTRFTPNSTPFSFAFSSDPSRLLTVGVESITATNSLKGTYSLTSGSHFSLIDSTVPHLWLPASICDAFSEAFGLTYDASTDLYLVNSTTHNALKSKNPSITIKLANSLTDTSSNYTNIVLPYAAFDLTASYPYYQNATPYFPIRRAANDSQYVLGRTLLQEAYLIVDYERANFSISQAVFPDPLPAAKIIAIEPPTSTTIPAESKSKPALGTAAIAGISAAGGILLLLVLAGAIMLHRRKSKSSELADTQVSETGSGTRINAIKSDGVQELGGTPFTELASPHQRQFGIELKPYSTPTIVPQELPTPATLTPRWREVESYEIDGNSVASPTASRPAIADVDGRSTLGGSPMTRTVPRYGQF